MIYCSAFDVTPLFGNTDELCSALSPRERERADKYRQKEDKDRHICALSLLSMLLAYKNGQISADKEENAQIGETCVKILSFSRLEARPLPEIFLTERGKPCFADTEPYFSLSHSHGTIFVALSDAPIGADVEFIDEKKRSDRLAERFFSDNEKGEDFFTVWTRKEAYVKMTGEGICSLRSLDTTACDASFLTLPYTDSEGKKYSISLAIKNKEI